MTAAVLSPSISGYRAALPRFALALATSAFVHLFLVQALVFDMPQRAGRPMHAGTLTVRIVPPAPPVAVAPEPPLVAPRIGPGSTAANRGYPVTPLALPQAPDSTYYATRDLDVYPRPVVPLDFDRLGPRFTASAAGRFRAVLLIDEGGTVNEIAAIETEPPGWQQQDLRAALAATRFFPGQKDGRAVKSRVLLSVSFDPAPAESGASR
jgi:periplasmic protein TonB